MRASLQHFIESSYAPTAGEDHPGETHFLSPTSGSHELDSSSSSSHGDDHESGSFNLTESNVIKLKSQLRDWNGEFQDVLDGLRESTVCSSHADEAYSYYTQLGNLSRDFIYVAEQYGRIIISEQHLRKAEQTVRPVDLGGIAGGTKYVVQGIVFKLCTDLYIGNAWLYGGTKGACPEKAMKAACNELKGLSNFFYAHIDSQILHFPMMALIHYRGYCMVSLTQLPISPKTLEYGSSNAGKTLNFTDPVLREEIGKIGKMLRLAPRQINEYSIRGPLDLEGHLTTDQDNRKRYYVLDFGRVFPPEYPRARYGTLNEMNSPLYNLFRPSFVRNYPSKKHKREELCSDGLSGWVANDPNQLSINQELKFATDYLYTVLIPQVAKFLDDSQIISEATPTSLRDAPWLIEVKSRGINCRHLGFLRKYVHTEKVACVILTECVARTLKNELREKLRVRMEKLRIATVEPYIDTAYEYLSTKLFVKTQFPTALLEQTSVLQSHPRGMAEEDTIETEAFENFEALSRRGLGSKKLPKQAPLVPEANKDMASKHEVRPKSLVPAEERSREAFLPTSMLRHSKEPKRKEEAATATNRPLGLSANLLPSTLVTHHRALEQSHVHNPVIVPKLLDHGLLKPSDPSHESPKGGSSGSRSPKAKDYGPAAPTPATGTTKSLRVSSDEVKPERRSGEEKPQEPQNPNLSINVQNLKSYPSKATGEISHPPSPLQSPTPPKEKHIKQSGRPLTATSVNYIVQNRVKSASSSSSEEREDRTDASATPLKLVSGESDSPAAKEEKNITPKSDSPLSRSKNKEEKSKDTEKPKPQKTNLEVDKSRDKGGSSAEDHSAEKSKPEKKAWHNSGKGHPRHHRDSMSRSPDDQKSSSPVVKVKETKNRQTPPKEPREAQPTEIPVPVPSQPVVQGSEHVVGDPKQEADGLINQSKQRPGSGLISSGDQIAKKRDKDRRGISRSKTVGDAATSGEIKPGHGEVSKDPKSRRTRIGSDIKAELPVPPKADAQLSPKKKPSSKERFKLKTTHLKDKTIDGDRTENPLNSDRDRLNPLLEVSGTKERESPKESPKEKSTGESRSRCASVSTGPQSTDDLNQQETVVTTEKLLKALQLHSIHKTTPQNSPKQSPKTGGSTPPVSEAPQKKTRELRKSTMEPTTTISTPQQQVEKDVLVDLKGAGSSGKIKSRLVVDKGGSQGDLTKKKDHSDSIAAGKPGSSGKLRRVQKDKQATVAPDTKKTHSKSDPDTIRRSFEPTTAPDSPKGSADSSPGGQKGIKLARREKRRGSQPPEPTKKLIVQEPSPRMAATTDQIVERRRLLNLNWMNGQDQLQPVHTRQNIEAGSTKNLIQLHERAISTLNTTSSPPQKKTKQQAVATPTHDHTATAVPLPLTSPEFSPLVPPTSTTSPPSLESDTSPRTRSDTTSDEDVDAVASLLMRSHKSEKSFEETFEDDSETSLERPSPQDLIQNDETLRKAISKRIERPELSGSGVIDLNPLRRPKKTLDNPRKQGDSRERLHTGPNTARKTDTLQIEPSKTNLDVDLLAAPFLNKPTDASESSLGKPMPESVEKSPNRLLRRPRQRDLQTPKLEILAGSMKKVFIGNVPTPDDNTFMEVTLGGPQTCKFCKASLPPDLKCTCRVEKVYTEPSERYSVTIGLCLSDPEKQLACNDTNPTLVYSFNTMNGFLDLDGSIVQYESAGKGDRIGVFYNGTNGLLFFTKNQTILGKEHRFTKSWSDRCVPCILVAESDHTTMLTYSFGHTQSDFSFPIEKYCQSRGFRGVNRSRFDDTAARDRENVANRYWTKQIKEDMKFRFPGVVSKNEKHSGSSLLIPRKIDISLLIHRFAKMSGVSLSHRVMNYNNGDPLVLERYDFISLKSRVTHMGIVHLCNALSILKSFENCTHSGQSNQLEVDMSLLLMAQENLAQSVRNTAVPDARTNYYWAKTHFEMALRQSDPLARFKNLIQASKKLDASDPTLSKSLMVDIKFLKGRIYTEEAHIITDPAKKVSKYTRATDYFEAVWLADPSIIEKQHEKIAMQMRNEGDLIEGSRLYYWAKAMKRRDPKGTLSPAALLSFFCSCHLFLELYLKERVFKDGIRHQDAILSQQARTTGGRRCITEVCNQLPTKITAKKSTLSAFADMCCFWHLIPQESLQAYFKTTFSNFIDLSFLVITLQMFDVLSDQAEKLTLILQDIPRLFICSGVTPVIRTCLNLFLTRPHFSKLEILVKLITDLLNDQQFVQSPLIVKKTQFEWKPNPHIREIVSSQIEPTTQLMYQAWSDSPIWPALDIPRNLLKWAFLKILNRAIFGGRVYVSVADDEAKITGVALWQPPHDASSLWKGISLSQIRSKCGVSAAIQYNRATEALEKIRHASSPRGVNCWHLFYIAVTNDKDGQALMQPICRMADSTQTYCYTQTPSEQVANWLKKFGFEKCPSINKDGVVLPIIISLLRPPNVETEIDLDM